MSALDAIGVRVETPAIIPPDTGNAVPILHEIRHALRKLLDSGESTTIDLSTIPFGPGDRERLLEGLGSGEVSATIDALGDTRIRETALPGVWLVDYRSPGDDELAMHIEIASIPSLLVTPLEEIDASLQRLTDRLDSSDPATGGKEE